MRKRRTFDPWFCCGCQKHHPVTIWIEGENHAGKWCLRSMKAAHKAGRNDVPRHSEVQGPRSRLAA